MDQTPLAPPIPAAPPVQPFWPSDLPPVALDERGCVAQDIDCRGCGYSLRALPPGGACPECSTPIGKSIHGDLLRFCDPTWVERVARGVHILVIAFLASIIGGFLIAFIAVVSMALTGGMMALFVALIAYTLIISAMNVAGYWMATTRDPGKDEAEKPFTPRAIARWAIVAASVLGLASVPFEEHIATHLALLADNPNLLLALSVLVVAGTQACSITGMVALLIYARSMALRVPDAALARQCRTVMWGYGISSVISGSGGVVLQFAAGNPNSPLMLIGGGIALVGGLPGLVFGIWAIILLFRFRSCLKRAAQEARATWART